jgi:N-formylglutamate amidohydrolase
MPSRESSAFRAMPLPPVDFVLGDRDGTSCELAFTHAVRDFLRGRGYRVAINDPYKGVELVRRYSNPATGRHSLQIEISRALYLDEQTYKKSRHYEALKADMDSLIRFCADYVQNVSLPMAAD